MSTAPPAYDAKVLNLFPSLTDQRVVLCSASPRRLALLRQIGLDPEVVPSDYPELLEKSTFDPCPWEYATKTATEKVLAVYAKLASTDVREPRLLVAADTIIVLARGNNAILEKPADPSDHLRMLKRLRDAGSHQVFTAVVALAPMDDMPVAPGYLLRSHLEATTVHFDKNVSDDVLAAYVQTGDGSDKAGGYAIQGQAAVFVKGIEGAYDAVVGLPLNATYRLIQEVLDYDVYKTHVEDGSDEEE